MGAGSGGDFGIYVHVPFCRARCDYCAFATYTDRDHLMDGYARACTTEILRWHDRGELPRATSVYFGGGTPSRLPAELLAGILAAVPRAADAEVTVECNPEDATPERLASYRRSGVTRISLGVQSTVPRVLAGLGRRHGTTEATAAMAAVAAAGFRSWSVDLILGGAGETAADWAQSLDTILGSAAPPPHVSAYSLTVEPGTPLARDRSRHPDEDEQADRYEYTDRILTDAGYHWEEISNWARPGHGCRHNRLYWEQGAYLGIGSGAHSHRHGRRWWNVRTPDRYTALVQAGRSPEAGGEDLDWSTRNFEALALSLRTPTGVPSETLPEAAEVTGLIERRDGRAVLTVRGRLVANAVTARLSYPEETGRRPEPAGPFCTTTTIGSLRTTVPRAPTTTLRS